MLGALGLVLFWLVPWIAGLAVRAMPLSADRALGEAASASFANSHKACTNPALTQAVEQVVSLLARDLDPALQPVRVWLLDSEEVNAFALPGGFVFVMSGLLADIQHPDELAGVLGHELGHVALRHGMTRVAQQSAWGVIGLWLLGGGAGALDDASVAAISLISLRFDREQEADADQYAVRVLGAHGVSPHGLAAFFARLPAGPAPAWLLTHPAPAERAAALRALPAPSAEGPSPLPPLAALQAPCHLEAGSE